MYRKRDSIVENTRSIFLFFRYFREKLDALFIKRKTIKARRINYCSKGISFIREISKPYFIFNTALSMLFCISNE